MDQMPPVCQRSVNRERPAPEPGGSWYVRPPFADGSIVRRPAPLADVVRDARKAAATIDRFLTAPHKLLHNSS
jgi:hypothetical protein